MVSFDCPANLFSSQETDNSDDQETVDLYAPSAPMLEQLQPLRRHKRKAPLPPEISHVLLAPPIEFRDEVEDVQRQATAGITGTYFSPANLTIYILA